MGEVVDTTRSKVDIHLVPSVTWFRQSTVSDPSELNGIGIMARLESGSFLRQSMTFAIFSGMPSR